MKGQIITAAAILLAATGLATADSLIENLYVKGAIGYFWSGDQDFDTGAGGVGVVDTELNDDWAYTIALGTEIDSVRLEFEIGTREAEVDVHSAGGADLPGSDGDNTAVSFMINALYDFGEMLGWETISPYAGIGLGVAAIEFEGYTVDGVPEVLDDEDASFAYQLIVGGEVDVAEDVGLFLEYVYLNAPEVDVSTTLGDNSTDIDYETHNIFVGVRYSF
jgi:opacity protein-like surface antigen